MKIITISREFGSGGRELGKRLAEELGIHCYDHEIIELIAKEHGFHDLTHEWDRTHHAENFDQIDSRAYLVHSWLKYPKFGHAAATDYTARYIRYGMMTREEAIPIIKERDGKLDPLCVRDFCEFCGYTETEFWAILDKFYNRDLFEKNEYGEWQLKHPIWEENK